MKKLLTILLLFVSINAQDILRTISGARAKGIFSEVTEEHAVFQQSGASAPSKIPRISVARVVLSNGDVVYMLTDEMTNEFKEKRKKILEEERKNSLTIEENQKLSESGKCIIGCIMAVVVSYVLIDSFSMGGFGDLSGHETAW